MDDHLDCSYVVLLKLHHGAVRHLFGVSTMRLKATLYLT